jgi:hypothetical protein
LASKISSSSISCSSPWVCLARGGRRLGYRCADLTLAAGLHLLSRSLSGHRKRRNELVKLGDHAAGHRPILHEYNEAILDQMIGVVTAATIIAYALYTVDGETVAKFGTDNLIYTIPFVVYGIFSLFLFDLQTPAGDAPKRSSYEIAIILATVFLWLGMVIFILYG